MSVHGTYGNTKLHHYIFLYAPWSTIILNRKLRNTKYEIAQNTKLHNLIIDPLCMKKIWVCYVEHKTVSSNLKEMKFAEKLASSKVWKHKVFFRIWSKNSAEEHEDSSDSCSNMLHYRFFSPIRVKFKQ